MESKIPLPTDNIYKFYALFGLLLFITSGLAVVWNSTTTNETVHSLVKEYEALPGNTEEKEKSTLGKMIEVRIDVATKDRKTFNTALGIILWISLCLMLFGFKEWQTKIQPKQDKYFDLQLQKLEQEVENRTNSQSASS